MMKKTKAMILSYWTAAMKGKTRKKMVHSIFLCS